MAPGALGTLTRLQRFPWQVGLVWARLHGRFGRLTAQSGGFRKAQTAFGRKQPV